MSNSTVISATLRTRALSTVDSCMFDGSELGRMTAWTHASRPAAVDAVPTNEAGRGIYANAKQDRPPREELR